MKRIIRAAVLLAAAVLGQAAIADQHLTIPQTEAERRDRIGLALEFTQCAGLWYAVADIGRESGEHSDNIELAEGTGRGADLVASLLAATAMTDPRQAGPFVTDQVELNRTTWRAKIRGGPVGGDLAKWLARCADLNPMQADIINRLRKGAVTQ